MTDERIVALDLVRNSGLNAIAEECHRLAVARGEYPDSWDLWTGYTHMDNELEAWWDAAQCGNSAGEIEEIGDLLHAVLSIAHHRGIDAEQALRRAMQRNAERARSGE